MVTLVCVHQQFGGIWKIMGTNDVILRNLGEIPVPLQAAIVVTQLDAVPRAFVNLLPSGLWISFAMSSRCRANLLRNKKASSDTLRRTDVFPCTGSDPYAAMRAQEPERKIKSQDATSDVRFPIPVGRAPAKCRP